MKWHSMICLLMGSGLLAGCASFKQNFRNKKVVNIGYFTDATITMMSNLDLMVNREETLLVRRFINEDSVHYKKLTLLNESMSRDLSDMVRYSIEIVNIAESELDEKQKVERYTQYISGFRNQVDNYTSIDKNIFDSTIREVREEKEFLEAIQKVQPLLNATVMEAALRVDDLLKTIHALAAEMDAGIDTEYAEIIQYRETLEGEKANILTAFEIIYKAYGEENPELSRLKQNAVIWTPEIIPEGRPTGEDLHKIGEHLHQRMSALHAVQQEVKPNWDDYLAVHRELDALTDKAVQNAQQSRIVLLTWVRAHQKMASGTVEPADWFDVDELAKQLLKDSPKLLF